MNKSTNPIPCADCASHCKPVIAILLIGLGLKMLVEVINTKRNQSQEA